MGYDLAVSMTLAVFGVNWLVQSSVLLALGLAAGRLVRSRGPAIQSAVYRTTLAAVLVCPIASALLAAAGFDGVALRLPTPDEPVAATIAPPEVVEPLRPEVVHAPALAIERPSPIAPRVDDPEPRPEVRPAEAEPIVAPTMAPPTPRITLADAARWGVGAWLLGSLFLVVRLAMLEHRMRKLRATAFPAEADAEALCAAIATRMNVTSPTVWRSPFLFSPCLDGLGRPAILLPEDVDEDLHDALVHELAHLARRDVLWNLLRRLVAAVLWFQPLLWVLSRRLEATAEEVCDDYVVHLGGDRAKYAGLLVELAGRALPPASPAAVGMISVRSMLARRVVRILDTSRSLSTRAGKKAILAMLVLGLASTTFAGLLGVGGGDRSVEAEEARDLNASEATTGEPIESAEAPNAQTVDVPIAGRIVDLEGGPVAGVVITVESVNIPKGDDLTAWIEGVKKGEPWIAAQAIDWDRKTPEAEGRKATTDADGRFRLDGLGAERVVRLSLQGEAIACDAIQVVLRKTSPFPATGFANHNDAGSGTIYGADFIYAAALGRAVEGVVRDAKTGETLAGAGVWSYRFAGSDYVGLHSLKTTTDAQGRFRLNGFPRGKGNALHIVPNDEQPYFTRKFDLPSPEGTDPIQVDVPVHQGIWIEGTITDRETGEPVRDIWLHYLPFLSNTFAQATPEFGKGRGVDGAAHQDRYKSKADGSFRLVGLPGRAIVGAIIYPNMPGKHYMLGAGSESIGALNSRGRFETYSNPTTPGRIWPTVMKEIDPPADATSFRADLQPTAGESVRVRIAAPDGRAAKLETIGRDSIGSLDREPVDVSEFEIRHLYPGEERVTAFRDKDEHLGKVVRVKKGDDDAGPVPVALEPLAKLTGVVVDETGAPVSGARIRPDLRPSGDYSAYLEETSTDEKGRFVVPDVPTGCDYTLVVEALGPSKTRKVAFLEKAVVKPGETTDVGEVRFGDEKSQAAQPPKPSAAADVPITGRIIDLEGRPVAGVVVTMERVKTPNDGDLTAWLGGVRERKPSSVMDRLVSFQNKAAETKTDADGRFRIVGLEPECVAMLALKGETIAYATIQVATRKMDPVAAPGFPNRHGPGSESIYGADFTYTAAPSRLIEGVVTDSKTGRPLAEAEVRSHHFAGSDTNQGSYPSLSTRTNAQGRFRIAGMPKGEDNKLFVVPNDEQPYFIQEVEVPDPSGSAPIKVDVTLHEGVWIEGKLTERSTGKPIPDARMHYFPFRTNPFALATPEYGANSSPQGVGFQDRFTTKADGSFRLVGLPGRGIVGAEMFGGPKKYMAGAGAERISELDQPGVAVTYWNPGPPGRAWPTVMKAIDPPADAKTVHVDLEAVQGDSVRIRLVAGDGRPVSDVQTMGLGNPGVDDRVTLNAEECDASNLQPGEERTIVFRLNDRKLGKVVRVRKGDDAKGPVVVTLEPLATITGRIVDQDGEPISGATIRALLLPSVPAFVSRLGVVVSGKAGRFVVPSVPVGCEFSLKIAGGPGLKPQGAAAVARVVVKPGETTDVGEIQFVEKGERAAQAANPATVDIPITGRIVDLEGRPVAGVVVTVRSVQAPDHDGLTAWIDAVKKGETEHTATRRLQPARPGYEVVGVLIKTDADGRFQIKGLRADRVVELMLTGESIALQTIRLVTRATAPYEARGFSSRYTPGSTTIYGADFTYTATPGRPIDGVVRDAGTGRPIAGVEVKSNRFAGALFVGVTDLETKSDAEGRFRIVGMPKAKGNEIQILPVSEQPYFAQQIKVPDPDGLGPIQLETALHEGIWIEGKVTDQRTGEPISEARLYYFPFLSNAFAQAIPEFKRGSAGVDQFRSMTRADGSFRLLGLPGRAIVGALVPERTYMQGAGSEKIAGMNPSGRFETGLHTIQPGKLWPTVMKEIDPPGDAKVVHVDLQVMEGASVRLRIAGADGQPISEVQSEGRTRRGSPDRGSLDTPDTVVTQLNPDEDRTVMFRQAGRKLGKVVRIRVGDDAEGPVVVKLEPLATITGRIADADGVAVPGAMIQPSSLPLGDFTPRLNVVFSDAAGRFVVPNVPIGCDYQLVIHHRRTPKSDRMASLRKVVVKSGETTDVGEVRFGDEGSQAARAPKPASVDVPITGRIVDLEGRPVAGVVATVEDVKIPKGDDLTAWIAGVKKGEPPWVAVEVIDWDRKAPEAKGRKATTDADGRFRIDGLGTERVVSLWLQGESIACDAIQVVLRKTSPFPAKGFANNNGAGFETIYGADFIYTAPPGRAVEGVVKDAKTGSPLAGAGVWSHRFAGSDFVGIRSLKTTTDARGRFRLTGFPRGKGNALLVVPNDDQPYFMKEFKLPDPEGADPIKVDVPATRGIWIEGKITARETGMPVPDAWLHYLPFFSNTFAQATPGFYKGGYVDGSTHQDRYLSKVDGSFRLVGLPGRAIIGAIVYANKPAKHYMQGAGSDSIAGLNKNGHFETYSNPIIPGRLWPTVMKEIDPPTDAESVRVDLQATAGDSVRVRIASLDGRPATPLKTIGRIGKGSYDRDDVDAAETEVQHLYPGEERTAAFRNKEKNLGKVVRVKKGDDAAGPVPVALEPLAKMTGVVVDENGVPVSGARIRADLLPAGDFAAQLEETSTDEKGRFVVPDVPTGCDYAMDVESLGPSRTRKFAILKQVVVKPGETTDVGEIRFKKD